MTSVTGAGGVNYNSDLDSLSNLSTPYYAMFMALAKAHKVKAHECVDDITANNNSLKNCAALIAKAQSLQNDVQLGGTGEMPDDMVQYFKDNNLSFDAVESGKDGWDRNIKSLTDHQETLVADTRQLMSHVQDFMGGYSSSLTVVNSSLLRSNQG